MPSIDQSNRILAKFHGHPLVEGEEGSCTFSYVRVQVHETFPLTKYTRHRPVSELFSSSSPTAASRRFEGYPKAESTKNPNGHKTG
jgi:hypothetical protein